MRRVLRDVIELVAHRQARTRWPHGSLQDGAAPRVRGARPAMQFGALALAQERLSEASTRRSHGRSSRHRGLARSTERR